MAARFVRRYDRRVDELHLVHLVDLASGRTRVRIAPAYGGRLAQIEVRPRAVWLPLLIEPGSPPAQCDPYSWGSFVMAPWPNRVARGRFTFDERAVQLPTGDDGHALHGMGAASAWQVDALDAASCVLTLKFGDAWPFGGHAVQRIAVFDDGLTQVIELHANETAYPAGCGWHPCFRREVGGAGAPRVMVDADQRYELRELIPTGTLLDVAGERDLRAFPLAGDRRLDDCYAGVRGMRIAWGELDLRMSSPGYAQVYTPPQAICPEPQTCAPDAFNLSGRGIDAGMRVVAPGAPLITATTWRWSVTE